MGEAFSLVRQLNFLLRHPRLVFGIPFVATVLTLAVVLILGPGWVSMSRFAPDTSGGDLTRVAGLAAQHGIAKMPSSSESIEFYAALVESPDLLREAVLTKYRFPEGRGGSDTITGTYLELAGFDAGDGEDAIRKAVRKLDDQVSVGTDVRSGLVTVQTQARWPALATALNRRLLDLVGEFNVQKRQSKAAAERRFAQDRLADGQAELETVENELERFMEENRRWKSSTDLTFQVERLQRRVALRQQVVASLAQSFEQARIDEVRNTPVVTVIDRPENSVRRKRSPLSSGFLALVLGGMAGVVLALGYEALVRERTASPAAYGELKHRWTTLAGRLPLPHRPPPESPHA